MRAAGTGNRKMKHLVQAVGAVVAGIMLSVGLVGCGDDGPKIVPVTGTISHDGKPLAEAMVFFHADIGPMISVGQSDENGHFVLTTDTLNPDDGAYVGNNHVAVTMGLIQVRRDGKVMDKPERPKSPMDGAMNYKYIRRKAVDKKYGRPETSGIICKIEDGGENHFDIVLE